MRVAHERELTDEERDESTMLVRPRLTCVRPMQRARMVLLATDGRQAEDIAVELGVGSVQVPRWRERYAQSRAGGH